MKKICLIIISILIISSLAACGAKPASVTEPKETFTGSITEDMFSEPESSEDVIYTEEPVPIITLPELDTALEMYADYLKKVYKSMPEAEDSFRYGLVYADEDAIPELVYMEGNYHGATVHMYMAGTEEVWELGEFGEYGSFAYVPGMSRVLSFFMNQGTYFYDFYKIENRTLQEDIYFEVDESGLMDDTTHYYVDGDEVDGDAYQNAYSRAYGYGFETFEYMDAVSYKESYDVYLILKAWAESGLRPPSIEVDYDLAAAAGEYGAISVTYEDGVLRDSAEDGLCAEVSLLPEGFLALWISYNDELITDYGMPIHYYMKNDPAYGGLWTVGARSEDNNREYFLTMYDEGKIVLNVSDALNTIGHTNYRIEGEIYTEDEED